MHVNKFNLNNSCFGTMETIFGRTQIFNPNNMLIRKVKVIKFNYKKGYHRICHIQNHIFKA